MNRTNKKKRKESRKFGTLSPPKARRSSRKYSKLIFLFFFLFPSRVIVSPSRDPGEARNWRTHFGGLSVDSREEKTKQGNRGRKERKKGKSSKKAGGRLVRKEREKKNQDKEAYSWRTGAAWRGVARRVASRVLVGRETLENPGYAKHRKMALQARTLGGTRN